MNYLRFYFFFLLCLPSILSAQKMIDIDKLWYISVPGDFTGYGRGTFAFFFKDSTIIGDKYYYQAYTSTDSTFQKVDATSEYYRENNGVIYRIREGIDIEEIIYNFNLRVGDSITYKFEGGSPSDLTIKVLKIDTIQVNNGSTRKRLTIYDPRYEIKESNFRYWIEGIGSIVEPFDPAFMFASDGTSRLSCFFHKETYIFGANPSRCNAKLGNGPVNTKEIKPLKGIQLLQNLGDGNISFRLENPGQYQSKIYDSQGRVLKTQIAQQGTNHCSVVDFPKGIYFLNIYDAENQLQKTLKVLHQ